MQTCNEVEYIKKGYDSTKLLLVGDIGGTHSDFAVVEADQKQVRLIISLHFLSREITCFVDVISWILERIQKKYNIKIDKACFAGAGPVGETGEVVYLTNLPWDIDLGELEKHTSLKSIKIINDFEAIGYGIDLIDQKNIRGESVTLCIHEGQRAQKSKNKHHNKIVIGAGTGLGKCILPWNENKKDYIPIASEGGHADFPVHTQEEFRLLEYIKDSSKKNVVTWEDLLSGKGIGTVYKFLLKNNSAFTGNDAIAKNQYKPSVIASHKEIDACCKETFTWFARFYGRCAKNFALEALALGGVYIAGGIAVKNPDIFQEEPFLSEFLKHETMKFLLEKIPIYVVVDHNVSLYGAAKSYFCSTGGFK